MPFTAPPTVASQANAGYLSVFDIDGTPIAEIKTFSTNLFSIPEVNVTHLLSPGNTEEFVPGMMKIGKITFSGNFTGHASQLNVSTLAKARTIFPFTIKAPVNRNTQTYTLTGNGYISGYDPGPFENNKAIEFKGEIQLTGEYTEDVT